jgi:hypothetical protein
LIRDISENTTFRRNTFGGVALIWCGADYIRNINASAARHTNIGGTGVFIITVNLFMSNRGIISRSIRITFIFRTFVIIINWDRSVNTSYVTYTFNISTSINIWAFIFRVCATVSLITGIYSARIIIVAFYIFIPATSLRITVVVCAGIIIVTAFFLLSTSDSRVARINFTST